MPDTRYKFYSKSLISFLLSMLLCLNVIAQQTIKGKVVNDITGAPISGSSVFITNTSKGTVTDNTGHFQLNDVPAGQHDLIISCVGYETNVFSFNQSQLPLQLKIEMTIKVKEMGNVMLEPFVEEGWDRWGKTFMDYFVGTTENAFFCKIKNEKAIKFRYYKKSNRLIAYCDEPVLLENKALGYIVRYQLENFEINFKEQSFLFLGYTLFEEMNGRKGQVERWKENRKVAYYGSITDFMKSLFNNQLLQNGFEVRRAVRIPNLEKERVKAIYDKNRLAQIKNSRTINMSGTLAGYNSDSIAYFQGVLRQPNYKEIIGKDLLTSDSLVIKSEGDYKALYFENYLFIRYTKELEEDAYLRTQFPARKPMYQQSYVNLLGDNYITVDKHGNYYDPTKFMTSVYWSWSEKMSNMLPNDYEP